MAHQKASFASCVIFVPVKENYCSQICSRKPVGKENFQLFQYDYKIN